MTEMLREWYSLRMDISHSEVPSVHNWLVKNERSTKHILALEEECKNSKNKEHLQALIYITKDTAQDIRKNLCRQKYKLRGRATKNQPSQYSVSPARDWKVLGAYVQKDQHPDNIYYQITQEELASMKDKYLRPEDKVQRCIDKALEEYSSYVIQFEDNNDEYINYAPQQKPKAIYIYAEVLYKLKQDETFKLSLTSIKFKNLMISLFFKNDLISPTDLAYDHLSRFYKR